MRALESAFPSPREPARGRRPRVRPNRDHPELAFVGTLVPTSGLRLPLGQRSGLQLFSGKKKESLFKVGRKMPFPPLLSLFPYRAKRREHPHPHVPRPELWSQVTDLLRVGSTPGSHSSFLRLRVPFLFALSCVCAAVVGTAATGHRPAPRFSAARCGSRLVPDSETVRAG